MRRTELRCIPDIVHKSSSTVQDRVVRHATRDIRHATLDTGMEPSMRIILVISTAILACLSTSRTWAALIPPAHPLFEDDAVHEIHLTFHQSDWWDLLVANFEGVEDPLYMAAEFDWEDVHLESIGVRFKGNSTYQGYPGDKKSFKLDIDEYVDGQEIYGLDKLNLNNGFLDPSFVREKCCYELCEAVGLPAERTNFAALYINDVYWGLYTLVEQFDQEFIESRFGGEETGNLWKGDPRGTLEYLGPDEWLYHNYYELKTNEDENDWSTLVELVDVLNNTPIDELQEALHNLVDVNSALAMLAIDNFTVNLDSYIGRCANYYFYHRDLDSRFVFAKWDLNEAWGVFSMGMSISDLKNLDPFWVIPSPGENRPLSAKLWQIDAYREIYLGHMRKLMATAAQPDILLTRMEELRDMIRQYVYADDKKMFSNDEFDEAMSTDVMVGEGPHPRPIPALEPFIRDRDMWLRAQIGEWVPIDGLVLNELMADNESVLADENGDYDDWIEVANVSQSDIRLTGLGLVDHMDGSGAFLFPDTIIAPGECLLIWADEDTAQGVFHAPFKLDSFGEDVCLFDGAIMVDQVTFPQLDSNISWGRSPDGNGSWQELTDPTPGTSNGSVSTAAGDETAARLRLLPNYPNPFSESTTIRLEISTPGHVSLDIFDVAGRLVTRLENGPMGAGTHIFIWNGRDDAGRRKASGVYFSRVFSEGFRATGSLVLAR